MMDVIRGLLGSKKAVVAILSTLAVILAPVIAYVVGQGIADHGLEAAKINAWTPSSVSPSGLAPMPTEPVGGSGGGTSISWQPKPTNGDTP